MNEEKLNRALDLRRSIEELESIKSNIEAGDIATAIERIEMMKSRGFILELEKELIKKLIADLDKILEVKRKEYADL